MSVGANKLLQLHEVEKVVSRLLFSPRSRRLEHMLWGEKQIGRNRGLRSMEQVGNSCCKESGVRTN